MYKILIADDEKMERDLIRYLLTRDFPGRFHGCADALSQWN